MVDNSEVWEENFVFNKEKNETLCLYCKKALEGKKSF